MLEVMIHIPPTTLLIRTQDKAHSPMKGKSQILHQLQGEESGHRRPFVVLGSSGVKLPFPNLRLKRWRSPPISCRDYIQVGQDADDFLPLTVLHMSGIPVQVFGDKTFLLP